MPSPFPGMDPWLEAKGVFPALHERLAIYLCDALNASLPKGYIATTNEIVYAGERGPREPDVNVKAAPGLFPDARGGSTAVALAGFTVLERAVLPESWREPYVEILAADSRRLVTAVEILSLSNKKSGPRNRSRYLRKQQDLIAAGVNLVELDLLRGGRHVSAVPRSELRAIRDRFDYHVCAVTTTRFNRFQAAVWTIRDPLPSLGIPLDPQADPVVVSLQTIFDQAYDKARFAELVDYTRSADPPLTPEQQAWAEGILKAKGVR